MIRNKYKIEKKSALELKAEDAAAKAADLREQLQAALADGQKVAKRTQKKLDKKASKQLTVANKHADKLAKRTQKKAKVANKKASKFVDAAPATFAGVAAAAAAAAHDKAEPVIEKAHDTFVDAVLPRVSNVLSDLADSTADIREQAADKASTYADVAHERSNDFVATLTGEKAAKAAKKRRCGTAFMVVGLLAAAGAAALTAYKQMQPQDDPWATPLLDPYTPASGTTATAGSQQGGTVAFSHDATGTNADLTPAEAAQGTDATGILTPIKDQQYPDSEVSTAGRTPEDDGAGELISDDATQVIRTDKDAKY